MQSDARITVDDASGGRATGLPRALLLAACLLLCLELRVDALRLTELQPPTVRADSAEYYFSTLNLRRYGVYSRHDSLREGPPREPDLRRWPGLSLLALPFADDPQRLVPRFLLAQTLASAAAGVLVYALAATLAGYAAGIAALLLYALAPHLVNANLYFLTESPATTLLLGFAFALLRALRDGARAWWIAAGALAGLATLTRPFVELAVPLMIGVLWLCGHAGRRRALLCMGGAFLLFVLPWHLLAWVHDDAGGAGLLVDTIQHGMYPDFMYEGRPETHGLPYHFDPAGPRMAGDLRAVLGELLRRAADEPLVYARWYLLGKPLALWQWAEVQGVREIFVYPPLSTPFDYLPQFRAALAISAALHYPTLLLALAGVLAAWLRPGALAMDAHTRSFFLLLGVLFAWTTALHLLGMPLPRYHMPLKPLVFVLAAAGCALALRRIRAARAGLI